VDDLLMNDTDVDGDLLTVNTTPVSGPANGTLLLNSDGTFTYTPDADFNGIDSFTYAVTDGNGGIGEGIVTITIDPVNDAPVSVGESMTTDEDAPLTGIAAGLNNLLANDTDADGDALSVNTTPVVGPGNGTLVLNSDGSFTYTPRANFYGTDAFTYQVSDANGATTQAVVAILVNPMNDAPVAGSDTVSVDDGSPVVISEDSLLANDSDVDGDALLVVNFTQPSDGALTQNANGDFAYTPAPGFSGVDSFTYTVADASGAQDSVLVLVAVNPPAEEIIPIGPSDPTPRPDEQPTADDDTETSIGQDSAAAADKDDGNTPPSDGLAEEGNQEPVAESVDSNADLAAGIPLLEDVVQVATPLQDQNADLSGRTDGDVTVKQGEAVAPPKFLYDTLQAVTTAFDIEIPDFAVARINELPIWEALDAMKHEMGATEGDQQFGGIMVTQIGTGMSLALSAGIMSWILRGGALASALLSTMPMWQGFDPLPILLGRKKRKRDENEEASQDDATPLEAEVDRLFEAAAKSGFAPRPRGSAK
jgi:VCBS repeat-containing protein